MRDGAAIAVLEELRPIIDRLAGRSEDGAFYLTQAMGGGKTHSLIAFGLLASDPGLRREVVPSISAGNDFGAAKVVIFNGHQNPENLLWGHVAERLERGEVMAPFWRNGAKTPGVDEWANVLGSNQVLIVLDELPSYLQMAQGELVGATTLGDLTIGAPVRLRLGRRRELAAVRRDDALAAAAALEPHRDSDDQRRAAGLSLGAVDYAALAVCSPRRRSSATRLTGPSARILTSSASSRPRAS
jgi:hypothetical protein